MEKTDDELLAELRNDESDESLIAELRGASRTAMGRSRDYGRVIPTRGQLVPNRKGTLDPAKRPSWIKTGQGDVIAQDANVASGFGEKYAIPFMEKLIGTGSMGLIEPGSGIGANPPQSGRSHGAEMLGSLVGSAVPYGAAMKAFQVPATAPAASQIASGIAGLVGGETLARGLKSPSPEELIGLTATGGAFGALNPLLRSLSKLPMTPATEAVAERVATKEGGAFGRGVKTPEETTIPTDTKLPVNIIDDAPKVTPAPPSEAGIDRLKQPDDIGYALEGDGVTVGRLPKETSTQQEFGAPKEYPKTVGISNAETDNIRKVVGGFDDMPEHKRVAWEEDTRKAIESGMVDDASGIARDIIATKRNPTSTENAALTQRLARAMDESQQLSTQIDDAVAKKDFALADELDARHAGLHNEIATILDAARVGGTEWGRAGSIRKMMVSTESPYSIQTLLRRATLKKRGKLTAEEVSKYEAIAKENEVLVEKLRIATEQEDARIAERIRQMAEQQVAIEAKKTRIRGVADVSRTKIVERRNRIKQQLRDMGYRVNDITGVTAEGSYRVGQLAMTYIEEGVVNLKELTQKILADMPNLTERDVWDSINAKNPKAIQKARTALEKRKAEIKSSARAAVELDNLAGGVWRQPATRGPLSRTASGIELRGIVKKLDDLKTQLRLRGQDPAQVRAAQKQIDELKSQLVKGYRRVKSYPDEATASLKSAREAISGFRKQLGEQDTIAKLEDQIAKYEAGIFAPTKKRPPSLESIRLLRKQLRNLKYETYRSGADGRKKDAILQRISNLRAQLDGFYRPVKEGRAIPTDELATAQKEYADLKKLMHAGDELLNINEQLRTGDFVIKTRTKTPPSPELEKIQIDLARSRRMARMEMESQKPITRGDYIDETGNLIRTMRATADMSGYRQVIFPTLSHPMRVAKVSGKAFKSFFSETTAEGVDNAIVQRPTFRTAQKMGVQHIDLESSIGNTKNEFFQSRWAEKIPGYGKLVSASNRHMTSLGNLIRADLFDEFLAKNPNASEDALKAYADLVNLSTGIGDLKKLGPAVKLAANVFFSPKLAASRFQAPYRMAKYAIKYPELRKQIARDAAGFVGTGMTILGLAKIAGAEVSDDPASPDFGQIRTGDTRVDIWGGFRPAARLTYKLMRTVAQGVSMSDADIRRLQENPVDLVESFLEMKFAPAITLPVELITRENSVHEPVTIPETLAWSVAPMFTKDIYEAFKGDVHPVGAALSPLTFFGAGLSTYKDGETATRKKIADKMRSGDINGAAQIQNEWNNRNPKNQIRNVDTEQ